MSEAEVVPLDELKERSEVLIQQIYSILTKKDISQGQYQELSMMFEQSLSTLKKIEDLSCKEQGQDKVMKQTLEQTQFQKGELGSMLAYVNKTSQRLANQRKSAITYFEVYHLYAAEIKKATLFHNSIRLLNSQIGQLQQLKDKHQKIHKEKTMFTEMQLNKQNEEAEFILEQITNQINEQLRKLKEKKDMIAKELSRRQIEYTQTTKRYEADLNYKNQLIRQQLKQGKQQKNATIKAKITPTQKTPAQAIAKNEVRPFQTQVICLNEDRNHFNVWVVCLTIATIIIIARMLTK